MHEMSLVGPAVEAVLDACRGRDVAAVRSVHLTIGEAHDVVVDLIPGLFRHLARGTVAQDAEVQIERVPIRVRCNRCATTFGINLFREQTWVCPTCGAPRDYALCSGREFTVDAIRIVVGNGAQSAAGAVPVDDSGATAACVVAAAPIAPVAVGTPVAV